MHLILDLNSQVHIHTIVIFNPRQMSTYHNQLCMSVYSFKLLQILYFAQGNSTRSDAPYFNYRTTSLSPPPPRLLLPPTPLLPTHPSARSGSPRPPVRPLPGGPAEVKGHFRSRGTCPLAAGRRAAGSNPASTC